MAAVSSIYAKEQGAEFKYWIRTNGGYND
jgi:hypothetical protein